ncbi:tetraspanin-31 isoform X3 [Cherax quadricarinatus]|uniref:tetraspanin-31 isoform X3 n=1 Tax=Cherax quadricarinatus TaxID=27406 RepID=UPI002377E889|nr:tetraspanin-13-like isoform X3 [Cherax quadricarinatus]
MCGGFTCSKNSLLALNILYVVVSFILIGVAAAAKAASFVTSVSLVSVIIACGVFLLLISIVGLIGASKHHQGWNLSADTTRMDAQIFFGCCGYNDTRNGTVIYLDHPSCAYVKKTPEIFCCPGNESKDCCTKNSTVCNCDTCDKPIQEAMLRGFNLVGGIGLFFSFTEILGFFIAKRYRYQIDPRANIQSLLR